MDLNSAIDLAAAHTGIWIILVLGGAVGYVMALLYRKTKLPVEHSPVAACVGFMMWLLCMGGTVVLLVIAARAITRFLGHHAG